jgi:hypothetical protein
MGLKGIVVLAVIGIVRKERSAGYCLHVSRSILGVLLPKGWVIILVLMEDHSPDNINKWDTCHTTYMGKKVLHLVKDLCGGGSVKGQGGIFGLLVLGSPIVLIMLLLSQEVYHPLEFHTHKHLRGCTNLS